MCNELALKPCPFCGSDELSHGWQVPGVDGSMNTGTVECHNCTAFLYAPTEAEAITAWNTRAAEPAADVVETLKEAREAIASLEEDSLGLIHDGHGGFLGYVRDQLLDKIDTVLSKAAYREDAKAAAALQAQPAEPSADVVEEAMTQDLNALKSASAWLDNWARHVANCSGNDATCTCGLTAIRHEAAQALQAQPAEPSEAEAKIEAIRAAMRRYLPPDSGITAEEFASEVIGIIDRRLI